MFNFPTSNGQVPAWLSTSPDDVRRELSTKEGWGQFIERSPRRPKRLTKKQVDALSATQREQYDLARIEFHRSLVVVRHTQLDQAWNQMRQVALGQFADDGPGMGVAVSGGSGHGKTAAVIGFLREYERELRAAQPEAFEQENLFVPVVYSSLFQGSGLKAQMIHLLNFFGHPIPNKATGPQLVTEVIRVLNACRTQVLALDQAQNLRVGDKRDEEVAAHLKHIMDESHVTLIMCGIDIDKSGPLAVNTTGPISVDRQQLARRFALVPIDRVPKDSKEWGRLLSAMESNLNLSAAQPGDLAQGLRDELWDRSNGAIGVAFNTVNIAANAAITSGTERITAALLRDTANTIDAAAHARRAS